MVPKNRNNDNGRRVAFSLPGVASQSKWPIQAWGLAWRSKTSFILATVTIGLFADTFLNAVIVPVLPFILRDRVAVPPQDIQGEVDKLLSAYALASTVLSPFAGDLADRASSRRVPYLLGLLALIASTITWFLGRSVPVLAAARAAQGASCAVVYSVGLAVVIDTVSEDKHGQTMGLIFSIINLGSVCAPIVGGLLYEVAGYDSICAVCFTMLGLDLVMRVFMIEKKSTASSKPAAATPSSNHSNGSVDEDSTSDDTSRTAVDETSSLLRSTEGRESHTYVIPGEVAWIYRGVPLLFCFSHSHSLVLAEVVAFSQGILLSAFNATVPTYATEVFGFGSFKASLLFLPLGIMNICVGPVGGWAIDRYGTKPVAVTGFALLAPALALLRFPESAAADKRLPFYVLNLAACGLGLPVLGSSSVVEAGNVVKKFHRRNPGRFPQHGPYAQLYAVNHTVFSLGLTVGPLLAGALKDAVGYGNMNAGLAGIAAVTALLCWLWLGQHQKTL